MDLPDPANLSLEEMVKHIYVTVNKIDAKQTAQEARIVKLESDVTVLKQQVHSLKNIVNRREQESRGLSVRISGFPYTDEEKGSTDSKYLAKKLHERVIQHLLNQAKLKNYIDRVPALDKTISSCHRLRTNSPTGTASPPPIILKFVSDQVRLAALRCKRQHMPAPSPSERDQGILKFSMAEDLTPSTFAKLKELSREECIIKSWTINGRIKFMIRDDTRIHTVRSVFDDVPDIISKAQS